MTNAIQKTLAEYRALDPVARAEYDPARRPGAKQVRHLQTLARLLAAARAEYDPARRPGAKQVRHLQTLARLLAAARSEAENISRLFEAAGFEMPAPHRDGAQKMYLLPLGSEDAELASQCARDKHPRLSNWRAALATIKQRGQGAFQKEVFAYRGAHLGRTGYNYYPLMQAACRISISGDLLAARIGYTDGAERPAATYTIAAGRGYRWDADTNGVRLVRRADGADYHPNSDEVRAGRATIVAALRERAETRRKAERAAKREAKIIATASKYGVWVSLDDSIAAGNCRSGTEQFARRHGLDLRRHYAAAELPHEGADNSRRVALAVLAAQRRQAQEMARGFCEI